MRLERHGGPPDLEAAFQDFVVRQLNGRALDDNKNDEAAKGKFPDFACFGNRLLIEMKHLEDNQADRVNDIFDNKVAAEEMPAFYGTRAGHHILNAISNRTEVEREIASKLARTIETHLKKANQQFKAYRVRRPRKNSVSVCMILNSQIQEFTPEVVLRAIHGKMGSFSSTRVPRFLNIDAVIYITEKHFTPLPDGRIAFATGILYAQGVEDHPWKAQFVDLIAAKWSEARTGTILQEGTFGRTAFDVVNDIPAKLPRYELWRLEYHRRPYLRELSDTDLRLAWNRSIAEGLVSFSKGSWEKPSPKQTTEHIRRFTHLIEELNHRGIDLKSISPRTLSKEERDQVLRSLPSELRNMFPDGST